MMNLVVISHKECWKDPDPRRSAYVTVGGFPLQMRTIAALFTETRLVTTLHHSPCPPNAMALGGPGVRVDPLPAPEGTGLRRKLALLIWLPRYLRRLWQSVKHADAVHAPVPGDLGLIGILLALGQRKPLFVRHCGTWGEPTTVTDRFIFWLLERIAGGCNVVMATGGGERAPSERNSAISWISSTSLTEAEMQAISPANVWQYGDQLKLVTVSRLTTNKNTEAVIRAMPEIRATYPSTTLDIVGDGPCRQDLQRLAAELELADAVTFHGNVTKGEVLSILQQSHLFVFPTQTREGFPKAVLEAMACGLPVIVSNVSVLPSLIGSKNGHVLAEPTPHCVATAVVEFINDDCRIAAISQSARETSRAYTLEAWQNTIRERLEAAWGALREE